MFSCVTKGTGPSKMVYVLCDGRTIFSKCIGLNDQTGCEVSASCGWLGTNQLKIKEIHEFQMQNGNLVPVDVGSCIRCFYECCCGATDKLISTTITTWQWSNSKLEQIQCETDDTFNEWLRQQM